MRSRIIQALRATWALIACDSSSADHQARDPTSYWTGGNEGWTKRPAQHYARVIVRREASEVVRKEAAPLPGLRSVMYHTEGMAACNCALSHLALCDTEVPARSGAAVIGGTVMTDSWAIFIEQYPQVMKAYRRMAKQAWFQDGHWAAFVGHYPHGIFMQVYKSHWYNQEFDGIHIELALDAGCLKSNLANIQLHITHRNVLPDRERFNQVTIPRMAAMVNEWGPRYELSQTRLSERLNLNVLFAQSTFARKVADEMAQVCHLGVVIDEALAELWGRDGERG